MAITKAKNVQVNTNPEGTVLSFSNGFKFLISNDSAINLMYDLKKSFTNFKDANINKTN